MKLAINSQGMRYDLCITYVYCYFSFKSMSIQSLLEKMHYVTKARMRVYSFMYSTFDYLFFL